MNGKEEIANRYRDAELDSALAMYLGAVEHRRPRRLAADILLSIGLTEPAAYIAFNLMARELLKAQARIRELETST